MKRRREKNSKHLVVDACVAQSAGETEHPVSSACRKVLQDILDICHHVVVTEEIKREWNTHQSRFTRKWRVYMAARNKPLSSVSPSQVKVDTSFCSERIRIAVEKDLCLLEAALSADRVIITRDRALQEALSTFPEGRKLSAKIRWIDPVQDSSGIENL